MVEKTSFSIITYAVFLLAIAIVLLNLVSVVFPALIIDIISTHENILEPFEIGPMAVPLIITNIIILGIGYLHYTKKLPQMAQRSIRYFLNFETTPKTTLIVVLFILFFYVGYSANELFLNEEEQWGDFVIVKEAMKLWPYGESSHSYVNEQLDRHVRMLLFFASVQLFDNIKIIPFIASILLILVTYFITKEITQKRFAGIISMLVLIQSYTFLKYDTVAVYENFWTLFYLLSLYLIIKKWYLSPISYILSIFSKAFIISYLPMSIFFYIQITNGKTKKKLSLQSHME